jgi:hypothetical protein
LLTSAFSYNLYFDAEKAFNKLPKAPLFSPSSLPLYTQLEELLVDKTFFPDGVILGFYCGHRYAHTNSTANARLPAALKGVDGALYSVLKHLNIEVSVRPIMGPNAYDYEDFDDYDDLEGSETEEDESRATLRVCRDFLSIQVVDDQVDDSEGRESV